MQQTQNKLAAITPGKPIASVVVTVLWILGFVAIPSLSFHIPDDPVNYALSFNLKWIWIIAFAVIWLMFQIFWRASAETTKLSLAVSFTLLWLALLFFFNFKGPFSSVTEEGAAGTVAFFALSGGLGVVLVWLRFLCDEL